MSVLPARLPRPGPAPGPETPRIVLLEPDPYLTFLLRLHFPQAEAIEADRNLDAAGIRAMRPDLVIVGVESSRVPITELVGGEAPPKILAVVDGARAARTTIPSAVDGILARPFVPTELHRAVRLALGMADAEEAPHAIGPALARARSWVAPARLAAVALGAVLEVAGPEVSRARATILALAFAYATLRALVRRPSIVWLGADIGAAATFVAATGGVSSNYMPLALVIAAATGLTNGPQWGSGAGIAIAAASTHLVVSGLQDGALDGPRVAAWFALFPLAGVSGGFASRVWRAPAGDGASLLSEANRVLSSLYRIARTLPGGLEIGTVADAAMQEVRDTVHAKAGAMLVSEAGTFVLVESFGLRHPAGVIVRDPTSGLGAAAHGQSARVLRREDLDPPTAQALGDHECWLVTPMERGGIPVGLLLAACPDHAQHDANRLILQQLAQETAVAVENARLFSRVREISIDEERRRLARELHDGIAQALTHLRFELEFMSRHGAATPEAAKNEVERLTRVVDRASSDVRSMIFGLRSSVSAEGLAGSLRAYLSDLRGLGGPEIVFDARGEVHLGPGIEGEIFRIAQEAVSNALRHAEATEVRVSLTSGATLVRLAVEDDGIGVRARRRSVAGGGIGLDAMRERAAAIGGRLEVGDRPGGGTRVTLEYRPEERT